MKCDEGKYSDKVTNEQISKVLRVEMRTIDYVKKYLIEDILEAVLGLHLTTRVYEKKSYGDVKAKLLHFVIVSR